MLSLQKKFVFSVLLLTLIALSGSTIPAYADNDYYFSSLEGNWTASGGEGQAGENIDVISIVGTVAFSDNDNSGSCKIGLNLAITGQDQGNQNALVSSYNNIPPTTAFTFNNTGDDEWTATESDFTLTLKIESATEVSVEYTAGDQDEIDYEFTLSKAGSNGHSNNIPFSTLEGNWTAANGRGKAGEGTITSIVGSAVFSSIDNAGNCNMGLSLTFRWRNDDDSTDQSSIAIPSSTRFVFLNIDDDKWIATENTVPNYDDEVPFIMTLTVLTESEVEVSYVSDDGNIDWGFTLSKGESENITTPAGCNAGFGVGTLMSLLSLAVMRGKRSS